MIGLRSVKWPAHQAQVSAKAIGCLSNLLPMRAALNKSVTFCLLVNRVGEELHESQSHAMFPSFQMLEGGMSICQATMSLAPLAAQCSSGFAAKEVPRPVSMHQILCPGNLRDLLPGMMQPTIGALARQIQYHALMKVNRTEMHEQWDMLLVQLSKVCDKNILACSVMSCVSDPSPSLHSNQQFPPAAQPPVEFAQTTQCNALFVGLSIWSRPVLTCVDPLQANSLEDGQLVSLDLKELELGQGLVGHMTCSADVLSLSAAQSLKSSFDVSV